MARELALALPARQREAVLLMSATETLARKAGILPQVLFRLRRKGITASCPMEQEWLLTQPLGVAVQAQILALEQPSSRVQAI